MRRGLLIGVLLAILVGAGFYFLVASPTLENISSIEAETDSAKQEEALLLQERNRLRRIQEAELQYIDALGEIDRMIPSTPQQSDLLNDLEALSVESNVKWSGASFGIPAPLQTGEVDTGLRQISVALTVEGLYWEVLNYMYSVLEMERILRVDSASFSPTVDDDGNTQITAALSLTAFTTGEVALPLPETEEEGS